jgi:hypothetical protein
MERADLRCNIPGLRAFDARLGDIDLELVVSQVILVEHADRLISIFLRGHGYEGKAFRLARTLIRSDIYRGHGSGLCKQCLDFILCG